MKLVLDKARAQAELRKLVLRYEMHASEYESSEYLERQLQNDFLNDVFTILGWDLTNKANLSSRQREVLVEKGDTKGRPDYTFRVDGVDKFFVEAKSPSRGTDKPEDILQAKSYGYSTTKVTISILTDFKTLKVFDTEIKPNFKQPRQGLLFETNLDTMAESHFDQIYIFQRDEVHNGSIEKLLQKDPTLKRLRVPIDVAFLEQLTEWREKLAKDIFRNNPDITIRSLNDVVQRILDRLIFIRLIEDREITRTRQLKDISDNWKISKHRDIQQELNSLFKKLNDDFNGEIFKPHPCETITYDSKIISEIIDELYPPESPYSFAAIPVELLGIIYEKYLGKTIRLTEKRLKVEEKPEVRKAGGVFYTPKWVVDAIVGNTIGELIKGKTPEQITKLHILDPACGSGSFLIGALNNLFDYHLDYWLQHRKEAKEGTLDTKIIRVKDMEPRLSIYAKSEILKNNIYGVDLDPQAVEITMMSLYIKVLEGERALPEHKELLPSLSKNIHCGNSLIGYDFYQEILVGDSDREKVNAFDWDSKTTGFGRIIEKEKRFDVIIGNPPYIRSILLRDDLNTWNYYVRHFKTAIKEFDIYLCFLEKAYNLLAQDGRLGYIMPNKWLHAEMGEATRALFKENQAIESIVNFGSYQVFNEVTTYTMLIFLRKKHNQAIQIFNYTGSLDSKKVILDFNDKNNWEKGFLKYESLNSDPWNLVTGEANQILDKINMLPKFGEYFSLAQGTGTRVDPVFFVQKISETKKYYRIFSKQTQKEYDLEKIFIKPSAKGKDIDSYNIRENNQLLIFPYRNKELIDRTEIQNLSPNLWAYLEECKLPLEKREKGRWKGSKFYCYGRPQNHEMLAQKKILVPVIVNRSKAAWDSQGLHVIDSVYIVRRKKQNELKDEYILALLNSNLLTYFLMKTSSNLRGGYFSMKPGYVDRFPLKSIFSTHQEKEDYEQIISLVNRINTISDTKSEIVQREVITLKEKIDELIYNLYGLTDAEKQIIDHIIES